MQNLLSFRLSSKNLKIKKQRTIFFPVVLYGCETWSLKFREEQRMRVFENKVLRRIFGPRRDKVSGEWRIYIVRGLLTCKILLTIYHSGDQIEYNEMGGACGRNGERRGVYRGLVGKTEGIVGRNGRIWENNIKMDFPEVGCWAWID